MPPITDHAQRRERIVNAACQVLATAGLDGFSMRRIAKAAGCTTGMVTHYFSSKRALVGAALDHIRQDHDDRARARLAADPSDPAAALAELLPLDPERANSLRVWLGFYAAAVADATLRRHQQRQRQRTPSFDIKLHLHSPSAGSRFLTGAVAQFTTAYKSKTNEPKHRLVCQFALLPLRTSFDFRGLCNIFFIAQLKV